MRTVDCPCLKEEPLIHELNLVPLEQEMELEQPDSISWKMCFWMLLDAPDQRAGSWMMQMETALASKLLRAHLGGEALGQDG